MNSIGKSSERGAKIFKDCVAGSLCTFVMLAYASSFATLIFGGRLSSSISLGIWAALIGSCVAMLVLSFLSSFRFALGGPDSNPSAIIAISVAFIAAEASANSTVSNQELLPTVCIYLFGSAVLCGILLYLFGELRWGSYIRYIPHSVIGGFLAGTGYLLLAGGWKMIVGKSHFHTSLADIQSVPLVTWVTGIGVGLILLFATRRSKHFLVIPVVLSLSALVFYLFLFQQGISLSEARQAGHLLPPMAHEEWKSLFNLHYDEIRWDVIFTHGKDFISMFLVVLITVLLNATSLELATEQDANYNQELKALGIANVLGGLAGGLVSVNSFNRSMLNYHAGASSAWAARLCACLVIAIPVFFPDCISLIPKPVLTGLIIFLGLSLLLKWVWDSRRHTPASDYLTIISILVVVAAFGITPGVIFGIGVAVFAFVVTFSRQSVVKQRFSTVTRRSNVERNPKEQEWLEEHGAHVHGFLLHGDLFFGTASSFLDEIQQIMGKAEILLIDLWQVKSVDASSIVILKKILRLAKENNTRLAVTGLQPNLSKQLSKFGLSLSQTTALLFPDLDHGLEWAESELLSLADSPSKESYDLSEIPSLLGMAPIEGGHQLAKFFRGMDVQRGQFLFKKGDPSDSLYLILHGQLSVYLVMQDLDYSKRLRTYSAGTIVGEMGFYNQVPRSADVVADSFTRVGVLTHESFAKLEEENPHLAKEFHRFVINTLSSRLRCANEELRNAL
jgi:SulP family sulfate permease